MLASRAPVEPLEVIWAVTVFSERGKIIEKYREFLACEPKIKGGTVRPPFTARDNHGPPLI